MSVLVCADLTEKVLAAAFEVHRSVGPGLLESTYRECLVEELKTIGLTVEREVPITIRYKELSIEGAFRADLVVENTVLLELKSVERLLSIHFAQTLTYLKLSKLRVGLLLNFNTSRLRHGIHRFVV